ncbi:MAG: hypothetical protein EOP51_24910 [Sphingobacteriales bacterium]|nr:MAG: hypothetical protein EOP51_24910 [Sphingobacteriales bacterium]
MRDVMLILHFVGLVMGLGTSFAHAFLDKLISKMEPEAAVKFRLQVMLLSRMGYLGIVLLIISGIYLVIPYWSTISSNPLLIIKLSLVFILSILIILIGQGTRKAQQGNAAHHLKKIEPLGKLTLLIGITIVIIAVNIFH